MGGIKHPEMLDKSDEEVKRIVTRCLHTMLKFPASAKPDFIHISRHRRAIPQYTATCGQRFEAVKSIQEQFSGLLIGGNLRDGIGMGHRITQATDIANHIFNTIKK
jgi:oxygen-dependent protoporphyrinogen oxidase